MCRYTTKTQKKLVEGVAQKATVDLIDITKDDRADLSEYNLIGFASGVFITVCMRSCRHI